MKKETLEFYDSKVYVTTYTGEEISNNQGPKETDTRLYAEDLYVELLEPMMIEVISSGEQVRRNREPNTKVGEAIRTNDEHIVEEMHVVFAENVNDKQMYNILLSFEANHISMVRSELGAIEQEAKEEPKPARKRTKKKAE